MSKKIFVPVITGPTASGKSALALYTAKRCNAQIISADSRQIYNHLNIGTAKPSIEDRTRVKHWLIDCVDPANTYSAFEFSTDALACIRKQALEGQQIIICGGTGFYLRALISGLGSQIAANPEIREQLVQKMQSDGPQSIFSTLQLVDPIAASKIHPHNSFRIIRALEVYYSAGVKFSDFAKTAKPPEDIEFKVFNVSMDRTELYSRINARVDAMVDAGLFDEFDRLIAMGYNQSSPGLRSIGYCELLDSLREGRQYSECLESIKQNSRRYAKRQITWFSHQLPGQTNAINPNDLESASCQIQDSINTHLE